MALQVNRLPRPYDYRTLIEAYVYTKRTDFVHADFGAYYEGLLSALERLFGIRLAGDELPHSRRGLWMLFGSTIRSLLQVATPWDGYLEAGLLHRQLEATGEPGRAVYRASVAIADASRASEAAHREMLCGAVRRPVRRVWAGGDLRGVAAGGLRRLQGAGYPRLLGVLLKRGRLTWRSSGPGPRRAADL